MPTKSLKDKDFPVDLTGQTGLYRKASKEGLGIEKQECHN